MHADRLHEQYQFHSMLNSLLGIEVTEPLEMVAKSGSPYAF